MPEEQLWEKAIKVDTIEQFKQYLKSFPKGKFKYEAEAKINILRISKHIEFTQICCQVGLNDRSSDLKSCAAKSHTYWKMRQICIICVTIIKF